MNKLAMLVGLLAALVTPALATEPVYISTQTSGAVTLAKPFNGKATLYKVVVSSAGTSDSTVAIHTSISTGTQAVQLSSVAVISGAAQRDFQFDVLLSSGLFITTGGSIAPKVAVLYTRDFGAGKLSYRHYIANQTTTGVVRGRARLKRVILTNPGSAGATVTIYNAHNSSSGPVIDVLDGTVARSVDYDVAVTSGITVTTTGTPGVTVLFDTPL